MNFDIHHKDPTIRLALAIILQAVKDYELQSKKLAKGPLLGKSRRVSPEKILEDNTEAKRWLETTGVEWLTQIVGEGITKKNIIRIIDYAIQKRKD